MSRTDEAADFDDTRTRKRHSFQGNSCVIYPKIWKREHSSSITRPPNARDLSWREKTNPKTMSTCTSRSVEFKTTLELVTGHRDRSVCAPTYNRHRVPALFSNKGYCDKRLYAVLAHRASTSELVKVIVLTKERISTRTRIYTTGETNRSKYLSASGTADGGIQMERRRKKGVYSLHVHSQRRSAMEPEGSCL